MGLIEVLIAVLLLSVGILGIAALQTRAIGNSGNAMGRSMATVLSYSILEGMRVDVDNLTSYDGQTVTADSCPAAGTTLAGYQLNAWCQALGDTLGIAGTTSGTVACETNGYCTITIHWNDSRNETDAGGGTQTLTTVAKL